MALEGIQGNTLGAYQYRPRAVLISTSGIFPVYLLKPWVNLYIHSVHVVQVSCHTVYQQHSVHVVYVAVTHVFSYTVYLLHIYSVHAVHVSVTQFICYVHTCI